MKKSSSFLKKIRKSVAPVIEIEEFEGADPLDNEYYQAMVNLRDQNLADTINAFTLNRLIFQGKLLRYGQKKWSRMSDLN